MMSWLGMLSYVVGTIFRTRKAVVVFDVMVGVLSYIVGTNFSPRREEGVSWKNTAFRGEVFQGTASCPIDISLG